VLEAFYDDFYLKNHSPSDTDPSISRTEQMQGRLSRSYDRASSDQGVSVKFPTIRAAPSTSPVLAQYGREVIHSHQVSVGRWDSGAGKGRTSHKDQLR